MRPVQFVNWSDDLIARENLGIKQIGKKHCLAIGRVLLEVWPLYQLTPTCRRRSDYPKKNPPAKTGEASVNDLGFSALKIWWAQTLHLPYKFRM